MNKSMSSNVLSVIRDGEQWRVKRFTPISSFNSKATYASEIDAATAAFIRASREGMALQLPSDILDCLEAMFRMEGFACYHGKSKWLEPWNAWMREGYSAAKNAAEGIAAWGWPVPSASSGTAKDVNWNSGAQL